MSKSLFKLKRRNALGTLNNLTLASGIKVAGQSGSTTIIGRTVGTTLSLSNNVGGLYSINDATATLSWTSGVTSADDLPTIVETPPVGLPKSTTVTLSVATTSFTIQGSGFGDTTNNAFVPRCLPTTVYRTNTVPAGMESIWPQEEMAWPQSAPATSWLVGGADAGFFEAGTTGSIVFKAATRASMTRRDYALTFTPIRSGVGTGAATAMTVRFPATVGNEFFVDYDNGLEGNSGADYLHPRKFLPGTADATGAAKAFAGDDVVFMAGDQVHRTAHVKSHTDDTIRLTYAGTSGHLLVVEWSGWGTTRGYLDGSDIIATGVAVTQAEVGGNPNWANILKYDMSTRGGAIEFYQGVFCGPTKVFRAQFPTPANLHTSDLPHNIAIGSEQYGFRNVPAGTSGTSYMCTDNSALNSDGVPYLKAGTLLTIKDPIFASRYGNVAASKLPKIMVLTPSNNTAELKPDGYNYATSTVTFNVAIDIATSSATGKCAFAVLFSPVDIVQPGQYGIEQDGSILYVWKPNASAVSVSRRVRAVDWGFNGYTRYRGGGAQRFCGGMKRSGTSYQNLGTFHHYLGSGVRMECDVVNFWLNQNANEDGACFYNKGNGTTGIGNSNIELCLFTENACSGGRFSGIWNGPTTNGDFATVSAAASGKIQANSMPKYSIDKTGWLMRGGHDYQIRWNYFSVGPTLHGNAISIYSDSAQNNYINVNENEGRDMGRFLTTDSNPAYANFRFKDNFATNSNDSFGQQPPLITCYTGWQGGEFSRNLLMNENNTSYWQAVALGGSPRAIDLHNNVMAGFNILSGWTGAINDNLITVENQVDAAILTKGGTATGNIQYTGGAQVFNWPGSFTSDMVAKLGSGPVGNFRSIP